MYNQLPFRQSPPVLESRDQAGCSALEEETLFLYFLPSGYMQTLHCSAQGDLLGFCNGPQLAG